MKLSRRDRRPRRSATLTHAALPLGALFLLGQAATAQTPGVTAPGSTAGGAGATAPGANSPSPGVGSGTSPLVPNRPLTLADVVNIAVGGNSGLILARQRLQKAQELIVQVNAQNRPQFSAAANDTYSSYAAFPPTLISPTISNPTLPGGGQIPTVVDQAGGLSTAFVGGGGGGNAPSTGATPALSGTDTGGAGSSPNVGSTSPAGPSTPSVGGASPTGGGVTTPGATAPGSFGPGAASSVPGAPSTGGPVAPSTGGAGGAAPNVGQGTTSGGTAVPNNGTGTGAGTTGTGGAAGLALLTLPAIIESYVADRITLTQPPTPAVAAPRITVKDTAGAQAEPRAAGDAGGDSGGASGTGTGTSGSGTTGGAGGAQGLRDTYAARASVAQYIDLFGLIPAARNSQQDVRDFYALDITRLQNETALAAKNLFFNVLLAQAQVATEQEQVNYAQENVRITQARLQQGVVSRFDALTAQTALATAQQQLIAAQDQYDLAQSNISYLIGTDPDLPVALTAPPLPPLGEQVSLPLSTGIALRQRPELGQAGANIAEARQLIKSAGSTLLPTLGLIGSGEYTSNGSVTTPRAYATISAQLAVPLDDGGATRSRVRSARVDLQTQALTLAQLRATVALEVRQAAINVRNAQAQVGAASAAVAQAQEAVRLAYVRYQGGLGTFLDVLNALAQLAATRTNLANAQFFYQTSLAQLVRALGGR